MPRRPSCRRRGSIAAESDELQRLCMAASLSRVWSPPGGHPRAAARGSCGASAKAPEHLNSRLHKGLVFGRFGRFGGRSMAEFGAHALLLCVDWARNRCLDVDPVSMGRGSRDSHSAPCPALSDRRSGRAPLLVDGRLRADQPAPAAIGPEAARSSTKQHEAAHHRNRELQSMMQSEQEFCA